MKGRNCSRCRVCDGADKGGAQCAGLDDDEEAADGEQERRNDVASRAIEDKAVDGVELGAWARVSTPGGVLSLARVTDAVVEGSDEREKCLSWSVRLAQWLGHAYQCRRTTALDVFGNTVEDGYAAADCEQQDGQQGADSPHTPASPSPWLACLCPYLFGDMSALDLVQRYGDISCRRLRLATARRPRLNCDDSETSQQ